jgi:hypothetical protein
MTDRNLAIFQLWNVDCPSIRNATRVERRNAISWYFCFLFGHATLHFYIYLSRGLFPVNRKNAGDRTGLSYVPMPVLALKLCDLRNTHKAGLLCNVTETHFVTGATCSFFHRLTFWD